MSSELEIKITEIVSREATALISRYMLEAREHMFNGIMPAIRAETARQVSAQVPATPVLKVQNGRRRRTKSLPGPHHEKLPALIRMASARTHEGFPVALWLYGPPGSGKNVLAAQVASALSVRFYPAPLGPTSTESKLIGYRNLVSGEFVPGLLCEPFKNGGLAFLDEVDAADPGVLVGMNALISSGSFRFADGEIVARHPDFMLMAGANTIGNGGTSGFTRNKLDAAFLDRFVKVKIDYDPELESSICGNSRWVSYVQKVRAHLQTSTLGVFYITPRASINGTALLAAGIDSSEVVNTVLFAGCPEAIRRDVINKIGEFNE